MKWSNKAPTKPGSYWFFGEAFMGSMGGHYRGTVEPFLKMILINVFEISNGMMAQGDGQYISLKPFDKEKRKEGYLGYWAEANIPDPPSDTENLWEQ